MKNKTIYQIYLQRYIFSHILLVMHRHMNTWIRHAASEKRWYFAWVLHVNYPAFIQIMPSYIQWLNDAKYLYGCVTAIYTGVFWWTAWIKVRCLDFFIWYLLKSRNDLGILRMILRSSGIHYTYLKFWIGISLYTPRKKNTQPMAHFDMSGVLNNFEQLKKLGAPYQFINKTM